jgi:hypothetical protein
MGLLLCTFASQCVLCEIARVCDLSCYTLFVVALQQSRHLKSTVCLFLTVYRYLT